MKAAAAFALIINLGIVGIAMGSTSSDKASLKHLIKARAAAASNLRGTSLITASSGFDIGDIDIGPIHGGIDIPCSKVGHTCGYLWKAMSCEGHYEKCWKGCCCENKRWYCGAIGHAPEAVALVAGVVLLGYAVGALGAEVVTDSMIEQVIAESTYAEAFEDLGVTTVKQMVADAGVMPEGYASILDGTITEEKIFQSLSSSVSGILSESEAYSMVSSYSELFENGQTLIRSFLSAV